MYEKLWSHYSLRVQYQLPIASDVHVHVHVHVQYTTFCNIYTHVHVQMYIIFLFLDLFSRLSTYSFHLQYTCRLIVFIVHKPHVVSMVMVLYIMRMGTVHQIEQTLNSVNVVDINITGMEKNMIIYLKCKWNWCTCTY